MIINPVVSILIPTFNAGALLDETLASIESLNYDPKKIFVFFADFGSHDETMDRIISFRKDNVGFYMMNGRRIGRTMLADTVRNMSYQEKNSHQIALLPGDILYPDALDTAAREWARAHAHAKDYPCSLVIGEVDLRDADGVVHRQRPLFSAPCVMRGRSMDSGEFARHGYRHALLTYGLQFSALRDKVQTQLNQRFWWNSMMGLGAWVNIAYTNQPLACLRERNHDDELDELVLKLELCISFLRASRDTPDSTVLDKNFESSYRSQLARFALWRAWLLYRRDEFKQAEDCYLFSLVIHPPTEKYTFFTQTQKLIEEKSETAAAWLENYYSQEEKSLRPKWPLGGLFTTLWNNIRMRLNGKREVSAWNR